MSSFFSTFNTSSSSFSVFLVSVLTVFSTSKPKSFLSSTLPSSCSKRCLRSTVSINSLVSRLMFVPSESSSGGSSEKSILCVSVAVCNTFSSFCSIPNKFISQVYEFSKVNRMKAAKKMKSKNAVPGMPKKDTKS